MNEEDFKKINDFYRDQLADVHESYCRFLLKAFAIHLDVSEKVTIDNYKKIFENFLNEQKTTSVRVLSRL